MTDRLVMVSGDGHAAVRAIEDYRPYFEQGYEPWLERLEKENEEFAAFFGKLASFPDDVLAYVDPDHAIRSGGATGCYDPQRRLREMDREGVAAELVFTGSAMATTPFFSGSNAEYPAEVRAAGSRAYNRWMADHLAAGEGRLIGVAQPGPCHDMVATVAELRWVADHGYRSVAAPGYCADASLPPIFDDHFEPFWRTCDELGLVVSVHAGHGAGQGDVMRFVRRVAAVAKTGADIQHAMAAGEEGSPFAPSFVPARVLYSLMLGGVFDRYPELHFAVTETRADWVPATLDLLDRRFAAEATSPKKRPSEYWQSNCYAGVSSIKESEVRLRERIGTDRMMFGRDYPHPEGTWPNTWDWLRDALRGITEDDVRALVGLNAIECYRLDARELGVIADRIGPRPEDVMRDAPCVDDRVVTHFDHRSGYHQTYEVVDEHALNALVSEDLALAVGR